MSVSHRILVIDDQIGEGQSPHHRSFLRAYANRPLEFRFESCKQGSGYSALKAVEALRNDPAIDLVLLDLKFGPQEDRLGFEILPILTSRFPAVPVLVMSSVDRDVEALGRCLEDGAIGFVAKDLGSGALEGAIERAIAMARSHVLLGQSAPLRGLRRQAARLSPYDQIPVMIVGERGTGKERVARYIHHNGPRSQGPFVAVNCAGLAEALLEAELFGAERGAYTGATSTRLGYLERAAGGALFLDEIGDMPSSVQAKLLRALQEKSFRRVGVTEEEISADFQVLCATNVEPESLITAEKLREDFYDRVAAVTVRTPPLRECKSDIQELAAHFFRELGLLQAKRLSQPALDALLEYDWPGNVRELRRILQEATVVSESSDTIRVEHLSPKVRAAGRATTDRLDSSPRGQQTPLPDDALEWPRERLLSELRLCVEVKKRIQEYKGSRWKAEFMRTMYPHCKASNAKGFDDLIRRLTKGPWGDPHLEDDDELRNLVSFLME